jgi:hypothetical protein
VCVRHYMSRRARLRCRIGAMLNQAGVSSQEGGPGTRIDGREACRAAPAAWPSCVVASASLVMATRTRCARGQDPSPPRAPKTPLESAFCANMEYACVHRVAGDIKLAGRGIELDANALVPVPADDLDCGDDASRRTDR